MGKKCYFLAFFVSLIVSVFSANVFAAGYTCEQEYTSCNNGYILQNKDCVLCTSVNNTTSTQSCTASCSVANGTCTCPANAGTQTCTGKYTGGTNGSCSGCSSWGTCTGCGTPNISCNAGYYLENGTCKQCQSGCTCAGGTSQPVCCGVTNCPSGYRDGPNTYNSCDETPQDVCYQTCSSRCSGNDTSDCPANANCEYNGNYYHSGKKYYGGSCNASGLCPVTSFSCKSGYYLDRGQCKACPTGYDCPGGDEWPSRSCEKTCSGSAPCPDNATCTYDTEYSTSGTQVYGGTCDAPNPGVCPRVSFDCKTCVKGTGAATCDVTKGTNSCTYSGSCATGYNSLTVSGTTISCSANTFTVKYAGGGNTGGTVPSNHTCSYNGTCAAAAQGSLVKTNYAFGGWTVTCTKSGGGSCTPSKTSVAAGGDIKNITSENGATITLTAVWDETAGNCTDGQYFNGTACTSCPSGFNKSDSGRNEITDCYKVMNCTLTQNNCTNPDTTGCASATCATSCTNSSCTTYKQYSNSAGTGNGTTSGTVTASCTKAVASLTPKTGYHTDGTTSCPANTFTVKYAGNGNTGGTVPSNHSCSYNGTCTAAAKGTLVKTNYDFDGWSITCTKSGGGTCTPSKTSVAAGGDIKNITSENGATITLTAVWKETAGNCTDGQYFNGTACTSCPSGFTNSDSGRNEITDCYKVMNCTLTQNNCTNPDTTGCASATCAASCTNSSCTTYKQYSNASGGNGTTSGTVTASCTKAVASLTPKTGYHTSGTTSCPANTFTVKYVGNGNTGGSVPSNHSCSYNGTCTAAAKGTLVKTNYDFGGWTVTCTKSGGGSCTPSKTSVAAGGDIKNITSENGATITLTAVWDETAGNCTDGQYFNGTSCTSCPSGFNKSDNGRDAITDCYVVKDCTLTQNNCSNPDTTGCASATCATSCTNSSCTTYKQYSNSAGTGNGTTSGTVTASCTKAVASLTPKTGYHVNGTTSCPANTFTVKYAGNGNTGGTVPSNHTCSYNGTCTAAAKGTLVKTNYDFGGWTVTCTKSGGGTCNPSKTSVAAGGDIKNITSENGATITLTAVWDLASVTCTAGKSYSGATCRDGYYCPGGSVSASLVTDETRGCERKCPTDAKGGTVSSDGDRKLITQCKTARSNVELDDKTGSGNQTCYYNTSGSLYNDRCTILITSCIAGRYREAETSITCAVVGRKAYSPAGDIERHMCSVLSGADSTVNTESDTTAAATSCYNECPDIPVANGLRKPVNSKEFFNGTRIPACTYTTTCNTGYAASGTTCTPKVYTVTLNHNISGCSNCTTPNSPIYLKYNTGWYSSYNSSTGAVSGPITKVTPPNWPGKAFSGYFTTSNQQIVAANGDLTTNYTIISANTTITASWEQKPVITCVAGTYYKGTGTTCTDCPAGSYCPGTTTIQDIAVISGITACPSGTYTAAKDANGATLSVTVTSATKSKVVSDCYATNVAYSASQGTGKQTCYYNSAAGAYTTSCKNIAMLTCTTGHWLDSAKTTTDCSEVTAGFYSPNVVLTRKECPNRAQDATITTQSTTSGAVTQCYRGNIWYEPVGGHAGIRRNCYHIPNESDTNISTGYTYNCDVSVVVACDAGYYDDGFAKNAQNDRICVQVGKNYYSPAQSACDGEALQPSLEAPGCSTKRTACPAGSITQTQTSASVQECELCPENNVCTPGGGIDTCQNLTSGQYPKSQPGTYDAAYCYRDCELMPNATTMKGRDYYTAPDTCEIETCSAGFYLVNGRCEICPAGMICGGGPDLPKSCSDLGDGSWKYSAPGSSKDTDCYRKCEKHVEDNCTLTPVEDIAYWPNKCQFTGESATGNEAEIVNGVCVEISCKSNFEMINGVCQLCNRENALSYKPDGNCVIESCIVGYHTNGSECKPDIEDCTPEAPNATYAERKWDMKYAAYGICKIHSCENGYHLASNACVEDEQVCNIPHGTGKRTWNTRTNSWNECVATSCMPGYTNDKYEKNNASEQCSECRNKFSVLGEVAAESYSNGCEIASCIYQGEKYNLDNNECVPICAKPYSDETGSMKWNNTTKRCERTCNPGYISW